MARSASKGARKTGRAKKAAARPARRPIARKAAARKAGKAAKKAAKKAPKKVQAVPAMYGSITPHLIVSPARDAIAFYAQVFGAKPGLVMDGPGGVIMHAELKIGDSIVMLADEQPPMTPNASARKSPKNMGGTTCAVMLYVKDADATYAKAVAAGGTGLMPPMDMFWGDRFGQVEDPFGHVWSIATHMKDLSAKEMKAAAMSAGPPPPEA
jgi:PhnB protein